ncbi:MAG: hypothetical protein ACOZAQ_01985 [Pseudomonadota bacterium]
MQLHVVVRMEGAGKDTTAWVYYGLGCVGAGVCRDTENRILELLNHAESSTRTDSACANKGLAPLFALGHPCSRGLLKQVFQQLIRLEKSITWQD